MLDKLKNVFSKKKDEKTTEKKVYKNFGTQKTNVKTFTNSNKTPANENKTPVNKKDTSGDDTKLRIIPLGGFEEVGKNCMVVEYGNDSILIDVGLQFAEAEMLGVDFVIPDTSYLEKKKENIRGLVITHGHLDHIGALPHILPKLNYPTIYGTKLTLALIKRICEEKKILNKCKFIEIFPRKEFSLGKLSILPLRVNHSIPDGVLLRVKSPNGSIVHTGDFKFDFSPSDGLPADYAGIAKLGDENIVAAFVDSTNSGKEGFAMSESLITESLEKIISSADSRILMALFSSLIGRISEIVKIATKYDKTIFLSGRSLIQNVDIAIKCGFVHDPKKIIKKLDASISDYDPKKVLMLCTGSQGEDLSALSRIVRGDHRLIKLRKDDTVVLSSKPIIGNERAVYTLIDNATAKGVKIVTNSAMDVHTSGHAHKGELMLMYSLLKPKYLVPIHGELFMRIEHRDTIHKRLKHKKENMPILYNGSVLEIDKRGNATILKDRVGCDVIMVDGLGVGDIGSKTINERQMMSENGTLILMYQIEKKTGTLKGPVQVMSKGFIAIKVSEHLNEKIKKRAKEAYEKVLRDNPKAEMNDIKRLITYSMTQLTEYEIKRCPLVVPVFSYV